MSTGGWKADVLVVDDEPAITEWLHLMLSSRYAVRQANAVGAALVAIALRQPDAVITDLGMDDGGGEHLLAEIFVAHPETIRIVYSNASFGTDRLLDSGLAHAVIKKSIDIDPVSRALGRLLPVNSGADGHR